MVHIDTKRIVSYVSGAMDEESSFDLEMHIANCRECAKRVQVQYHIREHFDEVWDAHVKNPGWAYAAESALSHAIDQNQPEEIRNRLKAWHETLWKKAKSVLSLAIDTGRKSYEVFNEGFLPHFVPSVNFVPEQAAIRTRGAPLPLKDVRRRAAVDTEKVGGAEVEIQVGERKQTVSVNLPLLPEPWPLIMLISKEHAEPRIQKLQRPEGKNFLVARFDAIPRGEYILMVEPLGNSEE